MLLLAINKRQISVGQNLLSWRILSPGHWHEDQEQRQSNSSFMAPTMCHTVNDLQRTCDLVANFFTRHYHISGLDWTRLNCSSQPDHYSTFPRLATKRLPRSHLAHAHHHNHDVHWNRKGPGMFVCLGSLIIFGCPFFCCCYPPVNSITQRWSTPN